MRHYIVILLMLCGVVAAQAEVKHIFRAITASDGLADNSAQTIKCTKTGRMTITTIGNINFYGRLGFTDRLDGESRAKKLYFDAMS